MAEQDAQVTDGCEDLRKLPVNVHAIGIDPEGQALIAAVRSGAVKVNSLVETVYFEPINTDVQAPKN